MRLFAPAFLAFAASAAFGQGMAADATQLRKILMVGQRPAKIQVVTSKLGCGAADCSSDIDGLSFFRETRVILRAGGGKVRLEERGPENGKGLPEMDWEPAQGFKVFRAGKRRGTCLHFSHEGIGSSGTYQRWSSVVLVPWKDNRPNTVAQRFVGYWAGCDFLAEGDKAGEVILPIIEPIAIGSKNLHLVWQRCTLVRCTPVEDARKVSADPGRGALLIGGK